MDVNTSHTSIWLITGTSNGLGLALAQHVLDQGHRVISVSRHDKPHDVLLQRRSQGAENLTPQLLHLKCDLEHLTLAQCETMMKSFFKAHSIVPEIVVNMAGVTVFTPLENISPKALTKVMQVNFYAPLYIIQTILPLLRESDAPIRAVVNVSSTQGLCTDPSEVAYDASKHALEGMSGVLAKEAGVWGIKTLLVNPGAFRTNLTAAAGQNPSVPKVEELPEPYSLDRGHPVAQRMQLVAKYATGKARGDPQKAARAIFWAVMNGESDVGGGIQRLILGPDAQKKIEGEVERLQQQVAAGKDVAMGTDFEGWSQ